MSLWDCTGVACVSCKSPAGTKCVVTRPRPVFGSVRVADVPHVQRLRDYKLAGIVQAEAATLPPVLGLRPG